MAMPRIVKISEPCQLGISVKRTYGRNKEWNIRNWGQNTLCNLNYSKINKYFTTKKNILQLQTFVVLY